MKMGFGDLLNNVKEAAVNVGETVTGADLDGDGDVGSLGSAKGAGANEGVFDSGYGKKLLSNNSTQKHGFYQEISPQLEQAKSDAQQTMDDLDAKIASTDDPGQKRELMAMKHDLQDNIDALDANPPSPKGDYGTFQAEWRDRLQNLDAINLEVDIALQGSGQEGSYPVYQAVSPPQEYITAGTISSTAEGVDSSSGTSGTSEANSTTGSSGLGAMEFDGENGSMTVDDMRTAMSEDPEALMGFLDGLSDEDRQMAMQMMMQRLQQINQMFSMMSNMMKSEHDTAKAAINNMRV
jgi:hypothetical protein